MFRMQTSVNVSYFIDQPFLIVFTDLCSAAMGRHHRPGQEDRARVRQRRFGHPTGLDERDRRGRRRPGHGDALQSQISENLYHRTDVEIRISG